MDSCIIGKFFLINLFDGFYVTGGCVISLDNPEEFRDAGSFDGYLHYDLQSNPSRYGIENVEPHYAVILGLLLSVIIMEIMSGNDHPLLLFLLLPLSCLMGQCHLSIIFLPSGGFNDLYDFLL